MHRLPNQTRLPYSEGGPQEPCFVLGEIWRRPFLLPSWEVPSWEVPFSFCLLALFWWDSPFFGMLRFFFGGGLFLWSSTLF